MGSPRKNFIAINGRYYQIFKQKGEHKNGKRT